MGFLGLTDLNDIPEIELLPVNQEIQLSIKRAIFKESTKTPGLWMISVQFNDPSRPDCSDVFENFCIPNENTAPNVVRMWKKNLIGFCQCFDIDPNADMASLDTMETDKGTEICEWSGKQGWVVLKVEQNQQSQEMENKVATYLVAK